MQAAATLRISKPQVISLRPPERLPTSSSACYQCGQTRHCLPQLLSSMSLDNVNAHLNTLVRHNKSLLRRKHTLFHQNDAFEALYVVRTGAIKTTLTDSNGDVSITGFYFPGDIVGLEGLGSGRHSTSASALDTTAVCTLPFATLEKVATQVPDVQRYLFRAMAQEIQHEQRRLLLLSRKSAEQRVAAFLLELSAHFAQRRLAPDAFKLPMSRIDMGNYLGMAVETLCRILSRFERDGLLVSKSRMISDLDLAGLTLRMSAAAE